MNNQFPAQPGTVVRQYDDDGEYRDIPVVGWMNITGQLANPICPVPGVVVSKNSLIVIPAAGEWFWCHPDSGKVFTTGDAAEEFVGDYLAENPMPKPMERGAEPTKDQYAKPTPGPDTRPLHFGNQTYKTRSFWHWPDANAVFEIDGEQVYPSDARAVKVKRDEYAQLKRDGAVVIDPHAGVIEENEPGAEEDDFSDVV